MARHHPHTRSTLDPDTASGTAPESDAEIVVYDRSPLDLFRVVTWSAAAGGVALATRYLPDGMEGLEGGISSLLTIDIAAVRDALGVLLLATSVAASLVVLAIPVLIRRWRLLGYVVVADVAASVVISALNAWVGDLDPLTVGSAGSGHGLGIDVSTDVAAATQMVAAFVAVAPFVSTRWRHLGMWLVGVFMVLRIAVAPGTSTHALLVLTTGTAIGSAVLLAFGRPSTRARAEAVARALTSSGIPVVSIDRASVDARGSVPWFARTADGSELFVKVLGSDQRAADLLFRIYRMLRLRNAGDERPFSSLRRTVEHEALVALAARDVGVATPRLRAMSTIGTESFVLCYDRIDGRSLDEVAPEELTDDILIGIWEQAKILRRHRIAHRDLRLANVFLTSGGRPLVIDFGFSEIAADEALLSADLAQLLVSLALVTGVERSTATAVQVLGSQAVAGTLARMQPAAMSGATQASLKANEGLLDDLRHEIERCADVDPAPLEPVTRITPLAVIGLVVLSVTVYLLAPLLSDLPGLFGDLKGIDPWWIAAAVVVTGGSILTSAVVVMTTVGSRLPGGPVVAAQAATAFAGKFEPAGMGAVSLDLRFLQRQGIDHTEALRAVSLSQLVGVISHLALSGVFVWWVIRDVGGELLVEPRAALLGLAVVVVLGAVAAAVPATGRSAVKLSMSLLREGASGLRAQLGSPGRLSMAVIAALVGRLLLVLAFYYCALAFGVDSSFATLTTVWLIGSGVAALAPTPGGLGAVEAALIGGLIAVGVDAPSAVPMVFLYRIVTFWVPALPGWAAFAWLRRSELL